MPELPDSAALVSLAERIKALGRALGFQYVGISDIDLTTAESHFLSWLADGFHGEMDYMARHGTRRSRPAELIPGTVRVISVRMDYLPEPQTHMAERLNEPATAYIARYALGRDYHKLIRARLQKFAEQIHELVGPFGYRVFTDSAPVLEKALAEKAGAGWIGKHTNLLQRAAGSWFFLGEIYVDLALPCDSPATAHCGDCRACLDICPTQAIVAPFRLDARRCISYLTIELKGAIPEEFRAAIGNRIYGCDDCQLVCPWNRFAQITREPDFLPRHGLDRAALVDLFLWDEAAFLQRTEGSAIRRIGYERWLRNVAVGLGNGPATPEAIAALRQRADFPSELVRGHVAWALARLQQRQEISDDRQ